MRTHSQVNANFLHFTNNFLTAITVHTKSLHQLQFSHFIAHEIQRVAWDGRHSHSRKTPPQRPNAFLSDDGAHQLRGCGRWLAVNGRVVAVDVHGGRWGRGCDCLRLQARSERVDGVDDGVCEQSRDGAGQHDFHLPVSF
jgi:hypothetical protein